MAKEWKEGSKFHKYQMKNDTFLDSFLVYVYTTMSLPRSCLKVPFHLIVSTLIVCACEWKKLVNILLTHCVWRRNSK
jgi:hypothetical protein